MSIWIIWKTFVWTYKECNFYRYWDIQLCIHPHAPPINSPYQPPALHANEGSQLYIFPNLLDNAHVKHFPLSTLSTPIIVHDETPQHARNLHLKLLAPLTDVNLPIEG